MHRAAILAAVAVVGVTDRELGPAVAVEVAELDERRGERDLGVPAVDLARDDLARPREGPALREEEQREHVRRAFAREHRREVHRWGHGEHEIGHAVAIDVAGGGEPSSPSAPTAGVEHARLFRRPVAREQEERDAAGIAVPLAARVDREVGNAVAVHVARGGDVLHVALRSDRRALDPVAREDLARGAEPQDPQAVVAHREVA